MEDKKLLQLVSDIGFDMLSYGGEIYRVEETVKRICFAYGIEIVDVFAIPSTIIVSITRQEETYSRTRRIISKGTDLDKVDQLNNLSRQLCREKPDYISACLLYTSSDILRGGKRLFQRDCMEMKNFSFQRM